MLILPALYKAAQTSVQNGNGRAISLSIMKNKIEKTNQIVVKNNSKFNAFVKASLKAAELKAVKGGGAGIEDIVGF